MRPALITATVLTAFIFLAPRGQGQQRTVRPQAETQNQLSPTSGEVHTQTGAEATQNEPSHWYKSPEWILVIVGALTAIVIGWQSCETRRAASAAKRAAEAATLNAQALINSERAWVMVDLERRPPGTGGVLTGRSRSGGGPERHFVYLSVRCMCSNQGQTAARVIEKRCAMIVVNGDDKLPDSPNLDIEIQDPIPHYLKANGDPWNGDWTMETEGTEFPAEGKLFVIYGVVRYRHLFSDEIAQTTFGYSLRFDGTLRRLIGKSKYNENT